MNIKYSDALRKLYGYTDEEDAPNTWDMWLKGAHPDDGLIRSLELTIVLEKDLIYGKMRNGILKMKTMKKCT